jgi:CheY-like chemotaxis protein
MPREDAVAGPEAAEADGLDGLQRLMRWHPDVVFCDLTPPIMSGDGVRLVRSRAS